jgi:hypothetical protein
MELEGKEERGPGSLALVYACGTCGNRIAMVTNPGETQMVNSLGVQIGHDALAPETAGPMSTLRGAIAGGTGMAAAGDEPVWSEAAERRLAAAPRFVQGMVRRLYADWAREHGVTEVTPEIMNRAREDLGLMEM